MGSVICFLRGFFLVVECLEFVWVVNITACEQFAGGRCFLFGCWWCWCCIGGLLEKCGAVR